MTENLNHLGLNIYQRTIIESNYKAIQPIITKRDKALQKIEDTMQKYREKMEKAVDSLKHEANEYQKAISIQDRITAEYTQQTCGISLTTEQCMDFMNNPEKFEQYKLSIGLGNDMFTNTENSLIEESHTEENQIIDNI